MIALAKFRKAFKEAITKWLLTFTVFFTISMMKLGLAIIIVILLDKVSTSPSLTRSITDLFK